MFYLKLPPSFLFSVFASIIILLFDFYVLRTFSIGAFDPGLFVFVGGGRGPLADGGLPIGGFGRASFEKGSLGFLLSSFIR